MTPEEFNAKGSGRQLAWIIGPGMPLAVAALVGTSYASDSWSEQADEVLTAAMTPVSVLAGLSIVLLTGALADRRPNGGGDNSRTEAVSLISGFSVLLTAVYFIMSLATLSVSAGAAAKDTMVSLSFVMLGFVLGMMVSVVILLGKFHLAEVAREGTGSERADSNAAGEDGAEAEAGAEGP